jgi:hypothetical protein
MTALTTVLAAFLLSTGFAQIQPPGTYIGRHRMGETFQEWLAITHYLDALPTACRSRKRDDKEWCKRLMDIRDGKRDSLLTDDGEDRSYEWEFTNGNGNLSKVTIHLPNVMKAPAWRRIDIQEQIGFLIQKYGQPTKTDTVVYQNSYGAKWDCIEVNWTMPDGTEIHALEGIGNGYGSDLRPRRELTIFFWSKETLDAMHQQSKPNPYDH